MAAYYNGVQSYINSDMELSSVEPGKEVVLQEGEHFVALGREQALVVEGNGTTIRVTENAIEFWSASVGSAESSSYFSDRTALGSINPELERLRYSGLWGPFAALAWAVEWILLFIQSNIVSNWGLAILALALVMKIFLFPLSLLTLKSQRKVAKYQTLLEPKLVEIKARFKGEEAHNRIMAAHKELDISPMYTLKPLLATLIQIPVLIAVFNALGEMPQIMGNSFLWISDLSFPDSFAQLPISLPMLGSSLNLLPILMTVVSVTATLLFRNRDAPASEVRRQKRNLFFMSAAFLILFYPFPASMVLYWTASNALHVVQQRILGS
jgi:YidC/Oxa1 family membrane protein insertase